MSPAEPSGLPLMVSQPSYPFFGNPGISLDSTRPTFTGIWSFCAFPTPFNPGSKTSTDPLFHIMFLAIKNYKELPLKISCYTDNSIPKGISSFIQYENPRKE